MDQQRTHISKVLTFLFIGATALLSSCNVTEKIDSPRGNDQILSAARACLDLGDYECAFGYYSKLSDDVGEVKGTEIAFATLDKIGLGLGAFLKSFSNLASANVMVSMSSMLMPSSDAPFTKREALINAYRQAIPVIQQNTYMRGLVRLILSVSLMAEILAEGAGSDNNMTAEDLVSNVTTCKEATSTTCFITRGCGRPGSAKIQDFSTTPSVFNSTMEYWKDAKPDLGMVLEALFQADLALQELSATGSFSDKVKGVSAPALANLGVFGINAQEAINYCLRNALLKAMF